MRRWIRAAFSAALAMLASPVSVQAATIAIRGTLDLVVSDTGNGIYSGTPIGTRFGGSIDDLGFSGELSDGNTIVSFGCCIAAGGLELFNDVAIDATTAARLNLLTGSATFQAGQLYDSVNVEGDNGTLGGGRIEVGVTFLLDASAFADSSPSNYPFDPADVRVALFFIFEEDAAGDAVYEAFGLLPQVPEPAPALLALVAGAVLVSARCARRAASGGAASRQKSWRRP